MDSTRKQDSTPSEASGVIGSLESVVLASAPIDPSSILSGHPRARSGSHSISDDNRAQTAVWECSAGSFRWHFGWEETVLILEGGVRVTSPEGKTTVLKVGDIAHFAAGTSWVWEIDTYVRKLAFCRRPASKPERLVHSFRQKLREHVTATKLGFGLAVSAAALVALTEL